MVPLGGSDKAIPGDLIRPFLELGNMFCEKIISLSTQPDDFETGAVRPEETLEIRVFWDGPGYDLAWEPVKWTRQCRGALVTSTRFDTDLGEQMREWGAAYFQMKRQEIETEDEDFAEFRNHHYAQHREMQSDYRSAVL